MTLRDLYAEKMRLEIELEDAQEGESKLDLMIDIASIENEIADLEFDLRRRVA